LAALPQVALLPLVVHETLVVGHSPTFKAPKQRSPQRTKQSSVPMLRTLLMVNKYKQRRKPQPLALTSLQEELRSLRETLVL
jgi:hypothetical protein